MIGPINNEIYIIKIYTDVMIEGTSHLTKKLSTLLTLKVLNCIRIPQDSTTFAITLSKSS